MKTDEESQLQKRRQRTNCRKTGFQSSFGEFEHKEQKQTTTSHLGVCIFMIQIKATNTIFKRQLYARISSGKIFSDTIAKKTLKF